MVVLILRIKVFGIMFFEVTKIIRTKRRFFENFSNMRQPFGCFQGMVELTVPKIVVYSLFRVP